MSKQQEKIKKIEELNQKLAILKEQREKLAVEAKALVEKRDKLNNEVKRLKAEAQELRKTRDEINARVKELKQQRNQIRAEVAQKAKELKNIQNEIKVLMAKRPSKSASFLQKEVETLEWKIQTTPLSLQEEKQLVEKVRQLEAQLNIHRKIEQLIQKKLELVTELKALEARAKSLHEKMAEEAKKSQQTHEEIIKKLEEVKKIKIEADGLHKLFLQVKEKIEPVKLEIKKILEEVRTLKEEMAAEIQEEKRKNEERLLECVAKRALEKLRRGEKLTWEEFKILAEKGLTQN
ncbi:MAG: hypothetical protein QW660_03800 [Candidatus Bathyarchaeia archaeon]